MLKSDFLVFEKLCTVLFGKGRLKITMKRYAACCVYQDYTFTQATCAGAPQNLRPKLSVHVVTIIPRKKN